MKRINPDTGKNFKPGDQRPNGDIQDGKIFFCYGSKTVPKTGLRYEDWITNEAMIKRKSAKNNASASASLKALKSGKKRINPDTGKFFKSRDKRPSGDIQDGKIFWGYQTRRIQKTGKHKGYFHEVWTEERIGKKRINPATGKVYKYGDVFEGKKFMKYNKRVTKDGYFYESWRNIQDLSKGIKRLNPSTGLPFKRGDEREDGYIFISYKLNEIRLKDGTFSESWVAPEGYKANKLKLQSAKKRINPNTGYQFKKGDIREDGMRFVSYDLSGSNKQGFYYESWLNEESFQKAQIKFNRSPYMTIRNLERRAKKANIPFSIDAEYLIEIFPEDNKCPVLGLDFQYGHNSANSPSVDRIIPSKGYVKGNVIWISRRANVIKNDASVEEIYKVADFFNELLQDT